MRTEDAIRERLSLHERDLHDWREPDGKLIAQEPDPEERRLARSQIEAAIFALRWTLDGQMEWPYPHDFARWRGHKPCALCGRAVGDPVHIFEGEGEAGA